MNSKQMASFRRAISRARNAGGRIRYSKFVKDTVSEGAWCLIFIPLIARKWRVRLIPSK